MKTIVLASRSLDRSEILSRLKIRFKVLITYIDEEEYKKKITDPIKLVKKLAKVKAMSAKQTLLTDEMEAIIIAADTIVEFNGEIIGKPKDEIEAFDILKKLVGNTHNLITGIAITETNKKKIITDYDSTIVKFLSLSDNEIKGYVESNEWKGRAGAYSIKDKASLFVESIQGSSSNVIGLPLHKLYNILKKEFNLNLLQIN